MTSDANEHGNVKGNGQCNAEASENLVDYQHELRHDQEQQ